MLLEELQRLSDLQIGGSHLSQTSTQIRPVDRAIASLQSFKPPDEFGPAFMGWRHYPESTSLLLHNLLLPGALVAQLRIDRTIYNRQEPVAAR